MNSIERILFLCPDLHEYGGIGAVARMALKALQSHPQLSGCHGEVYSYWNPPDEVAGVNGGGWPHRYARGGKIRFMMWGLRAGLRDASDTVVVCMHPHLMPATIPLTTCGARVNVVMHGTEVWVPLKTFRAACLSRAHTLIAVSKFTADRFRSNNPGFRDREITICSLGAPAIEGTPAGGATMEGTFALIVGRLVSTERYKGHDELLEIWPSLRQQYPDARLVVAGDGDDRPRLESKARDLGLSQWVRFLGRVSQETLQQWYRDCAFFVMPSSGEGFGLVFLEAMRAGKACIGGQGAPAEIIEHEKTGLIVPPQDREALRAAVTRLFSDAALRLRMGTAGRERFCEKFTEQHFQQRFLTALGLKRA